MEGFLPPMWCLIWYIVMIPIVGYGLYQIRKLVDENPDITALLAVSGAFMFVLSSLKLPSVTGSCSHPCGNGLGVALFGPAVTGVLATIVLLFQALLLAHGGITTLGANCVSMGIVGPFVGWLGSMPKSRTWIQSQHFYMCFLSRHRNLCCYIHTISISFPNTKPWRSNC